jgi:hypothetical protein
VNRTRSGVTWPTRPRGRSARNGEPNEGEVAGVKPIPNRTCPAAAQQDRAAAGPIEVTCGTCGAMNHATLDCPQPPLRRAPQGVGVWEKFDGSCQHAAGASHGSYIGHEPHVLRRVPNPAPVLIDRELSARVLRMIHAPVGAEEAE